jgi:phospholipid/cholesterol/gamma-HCH transport system substrate-binding protein
VSRRTEIQVGATVIAALAVLLFGVTWLKQISLARKMVTWHVAFPQAGGIGEGDEVQVNGIKKGDVKRVDLYGDGVIVDLSLLSDVHLSDRSRISIRDIGVMGDKVVYVAIGEGGQVWNPRDTIPGYYDKGIADVMADLGGTVEHITKIAEDLQAVTATAHGNGDIAIAVRNFRHTSDELRKVVGENRAMVRSTLANFNAASGTAKRLTTGREAELKRTLDELSTAAANMNRLSDRLDSLSNTLQTVSRKVERGEGTLGKLVNDEKAYTDLRASLNNLNALIADIQKNPKKYFKFSVF